MLGVTWAAGAEVEKNGGSERRAGAVVGELTGVGAAAVAAAKLAAAEVVLVAAVGVWDEEALPYDWAEKAAEAWNRVGLEM